MRVIMPSIFLVLFCWFIVSINESIDNTSKNNIYHLKYTVVALGQCDNTKCSYTARAENDTVTPEYGSSPVSIGSIVYKMCWEEKVKGKMCYTHTSTTKETG